MKKREIHEGLVETHDVVLRIVTRKDQDVIDLMTKAFIDLNPVGHWSHNFVVVGVVSESKQVPILTAENQEEKEKDND